ncbi:MAG: hypothetical protein JWO77_3688 [Ilumatobacteraceae bacterium]|nr:hypothetical protein [Ilumatobacteraceae bacterium]
MAASSDAAARRAEVERQLASGDITGLRALAARLDDEGIAVTPDELRADVRSLGAVRVRRRDTSVLALPVDGPARPGGSSPRLAAAVTSDPDWPVQVGVAVVVAVFALIALLGWLIST